MDRIKKVYIMSLGEWYMSDKQNHRNDYCVIEETGRNGEMARIPTITIRTKQGIFIELDKSECIVYKKNT